MMIEDKIISINFMVEKRSGEGEDSEPLLIMKDKLCAVGVFDGMGGSGATLCNSEFGPKHTQAYVASRIIKNTIEEYINSEDNNEKITPQNLTEIIQKRYIKEKETFSEKSKSRLISKLVKEYPTTLAITTACCQTDEYVVNSYWAGDSRNFFWTQNGLYQISKDDLNTDLDPLENLRNDAALSNCLQAGNDFTINHRTFSEKIPFAILSATDGCFGYFPTPMHFEYVLSNTLAKSSSCEEWQEKLKDEIRIVAGDDISLSLIAIGFDSFDCLKGLLGNSDSQQLEEYLSISKEIDKIKEDLKVKKKLLDTAIQNGWNIYKQRYMSKFEEKSNIQPPLSLDETKKKI